MPEQTSRADDTSFESFPVVALGASAGGLDPLRRLLGALPSEPGVALVVIQHLSPDQPSMLTSILARATSLPVTEAVDGVRLEPDHVYVLPADAELGVKSGHLQLLRRSTKHTHVSIDAFFNSLAEDVGRRAIAVVLSGSGADGTQGLQAIKDAGGFTLAQSLDSAQFDAMPRSALESDVVDRQGDPEELAKQIVEWVRHGRRAPSKPAEEAPPLGDEDSLAVLFRLMQRQGGADFTGYKRSTLGRRIHRRMAVKRVDTIDEYAELASEDPEEVRALVREMLIQVTSFFRDPESFDALDKQVLRPLVSEKLDEHDGRVRVWVPGCSSGEEVYSIGMLLLEALDEREASLPITLFGSDLSDEAIVKAREGVYSEEALAGVSPARREAFFYKVEGGFKVARRLRDRCVFVKHDVISDPPFTNLDLVSCRNLLIYFGAELQRRAVPLLHFGLVRRGALFLGFNESVAAYPNLFEETDAHHGLFQKRGTSTRLVLPTAVATKAWGSTEPPSDASFSATRAHGARRQADHFLLTRFSPPGVLVNRDFEVIDYRGRTGAYLQVPPGQPETNVLRLAREGLESCLKEALEQAVEQDETVRHENLSVESDARVHEFDLEVIPLVGGDKPSERTFLVIFLERTDTEWTRPEPAAPRWKDAPPDDEQARRLRAQLALTKDHLQAVIADGRSTAEDLAAANEELIAGNEELQSTNEELQSAKEELQSTNEEIGTVNDELRSRNVELDVYASDLLNVLASVKIPVIIVDLSLRVRRFTPTVNEVANLLASDVGRPIDDVKLRVDIDDLAERVQEVIDTLEPREWELTDADGHWRRLQIRPYRTVDDRLDGAVLSFINVDALKQAVVDAEHARDDAGRIVEAMPVGMVVLDKSLRVVSVNRSFYETCKLLPEHSIEGQAFAELADGAWNVAPLLERLKASEDFSDLEIELTLPGDDRRVVSVSGRDIAWKGGVSTMLLAIDDLTVLRELEKERERLMGAETQARRDAERANQAKDLFLATLSHELRTPLSTLLMQAHLLKRQAPDVPAIARASEAIERAAHAQARLVDDLLDVSRIIAGKLRLDMSDVGLRDVVQSALEMNVPYVDSQGLRLDVELGDFDSTMFGDAARLQQVVSNLLTNAVKFTPRGGRIKVRLALLKTSEQIQLTVSDTGIGIDPALIPSLFGTFSQAESAMTRTHGGLGLGLAIVRHIVEAHGGEVCGDSEGEGKGATFTVVLPHQPPVETESTVASTEGRELDGERVLVVEDDDDAREALAAMLEELGLVVDSAASAPAGLEKMDSFRPQLILSDIAMPGEDGYSFMRKVRKRSPEEGGLVPAAALTALASEDDRRNALDAGFQMHLPKPLDMDRVAQLLRRLVATKVSAV